MIKPLIPLWYTFTTRFKSIPDKISWILIYFIPVILISYFYSPFSFFYSLFLLIFPILATYSLYEIGYIENDIQTTKVESHPTFRLPKSIHVLLDQNYNSIQKIKYLCTLFLFGICFYINFLGFQVNFLLLFIGLVFTRAVFFFHNHVRNRWNILSFALLSFLKYAVPSLFLTSSMLIQSIGIILLMFTIIRTLEHATKPKYKLTMLQKVIGNHDLFRSYYYSFLLLLFFVLYYFDFIFIKSYFIIISIFWVYRMLICVGIKINFIQRQ
jgi:hypothetical protein